MIIFSSSSTLICTTKLDVEESLTGSQLQQCRAEILNLFYNLHVKNWSNRVPTPLEGSHIMQKDIL